MAVTISDKTRSVLEAIQNCQTLAEVSLVMRIHGFTVGSDERMVWENSDHLVFVVCARSWCVHFPCAWRGQAIVRYKDIRRLLAGEDVAMFENPDRVDRSAFERMANV